MQPIVAVGSCVSSLLLQSYNSLTLLGDTNSLSTTSSGLCVLSLDAQTPVMPQTTVIPARHTQCLQTVALAQLPCC